MPTTVRAAATEAAAETEMPKVHDKPCRVTISQKYLAYCQTCRWSSGVGSVVRRRPAVSSTVKIPFAWYAHANELGVTVNSCQCSTSKTRRS